MLGGMKTVSLLTSCLLAAIFGAIVFTRTIHASEDWTEQAVSTNPAVAQKAQDYLREKGPEGLQEFEQRFTKETARHRAGAASDEKWKRIGAALDRIGGQYDNYASGLYWYTDLEKAKAAARASGKPILSLRLLGRLDTDLSCANSRFFRTTLYPNAEINQLLRDQFILHWESVRPVPKVTIDFGDGRKLERTITGNSIHYVLDSDGRVVDALPGLYGAPAFKAELVKAADAVEQARKAGTHDYAAHMKSTADRLLHAWADDLKTINADAPHDTVLTEDSLQSYMDDNKWRMLADLHDQAGFDSHVMELMTRKLSGVETGFSNSQAAVPVQPAANDMKMKKSAAGPKPRIVQYPTAEFAAPMAMSKMAVETPLMRAVGKLANNVALDTVRNNYMMRTKILAFLANGSAQSLSLAQVNDWVYANVFLTPRQDPWLGLAPNDVYAAIDQNGRLK